MKKSELESLIENILKRVLTEDNSILDKKIKNPKTGKPHTTQELASLTVGNSTTKCHKGK